MIEEIKKRLQYIESNNLFDAHYINDMKFLISEVALWKEKEFQACSMHHEYHEDIEKLESQIAELKRVLERIAVTFERGEMVRIAYETLRSIKGVETE